MINGEMKVKSKMEVSKYKHQLVRNKYSQNKIKAKIKYIPMIVELKKKVFFLQNIKLHQKII